MIHRAPSVVVGSVGEYPTPRLPASTIIPVHEVVLPLDCAQIAPHVEGQSRVQARWPAQLAWLRCSGPGDLLRIFRHCLRRAWISRSGQTIVRPCFSTLGSARQRLIPFAHSGGSLLRLRWE
jgi:hypothetical protein